MTSTVALVLAHELRISIETITPRDSLRLALAVEFYHPLVHWLTGRLNLQQELGADAIGARLAGGSDAYLLSLLCLASARHSSRKLAGESVSPGTRDTDQEDRYVAESLAERHAAVIEIATIPVRPRLDRNGHRRRCDSGAARAAEGSNPSPPTTASRQNRDDKKPADDPVSEVTNVSVNDTRTFTFRPDTPFDASFVSANAPGLIAFRPASILRRTQSRNALAFLLADFGGDLPSIAKQLGVEPPAPGQGEIGLDQIDWIMLTLGFAKTKAGPNGGPQMHRLEMGLPTIRMLKPFDWLGFLRAWKVPFAAVSTNGFTYYQIKATGKLKRLLGEKSHCVYLPDPRTIVFQEEPELLKMLVKTKPSIPNFVSGMDWERSTNALLSVVIANKFGEISDRYDLGRKDDRFVLTLFKGVDHWLFRVEDSDSIAISAHAACAADCSEDIAAAARSFLELARNSLAAREIRESANSIQERGWRMLNALVQNARLETGKRTVDIQSERICTLADYGSVMEALMKQQVPAAEPGRSPARVANGEREEKGKSVPR